MPESRKGRVWLEQHLSPAQTVWFKLFSREEETLHCLVSVSGASYCLVSVSRGSLRSLCLNDEVLRLGLARTVPVSGLHPQACGSTNGYSGQRSRLSGRGGACGKKTAYGRGPHRLSDSDSSGGSSSGLLVPVSCPTSHHPPTLSWIPHSTTPLDSPPDLLTLSQPPFAPAASSSFP
ncbi:unnamed protein product [Coregonus sp. 'balchen']|nr:unnamed protein product [Coregonus sp. 'balchen']